jgi:hypothetical protein
MGDMTPVFAIDHLRFLDASQRTIREAEPLDEWPGSETEDLAPLVERGGNNLATQRSPWGEGVKR